MLPGIMTPLAARCLHGHPRCRTWRGPERAGAAPHSEQVDLGHAGRPREAAAGCVLRRPRRLRRSSKRVSPTSREVF